MNAVYDHGHHGNALLSAFPIANQANHDVSDHAYEQRGILHCVLQTPGGPVHCYVVHLGLFEGSRRRQTQALIAAVRESAPNGEPVVIAGDFNDWRNTLSDELRNALGVAKRSMKSAAIRRWTTSCASCAARASRRRAPSRPACRSSAWTASMCAVSGGDGAGDARQPVGQAVRPRAHRRLADAGLTPLCAP
jgi:endonuclease/exonuclease/phosphatase family metal-dependent hydrolase